MAYPTSPLNWACGPKAFTPLNSAMPPDMQNLPLKPTHPQHCKAQSLSILQMFPPQDFTLS